ncbi:MAG: pyridoxal phosphate-dependent aminotransferase [Candidatus Marinamargulisbacteria bacterium]
MTFFSERVKQIPPSGIRVFFDLVMNSKDVISLGVGEPDFSTPWNIRDEAIYRIESGSTTYTSNRGLLALREAISQYLYHQFNIVYSSDELLITNGVSEGVDIVFRSVINPGDEILLPEPSYVCYRPLIELCGGKVVSIDTSKSDFIPLIADMKAALTPKTKAIVLSYPNNPTGQSIPQSTLEEIADFALDNNLLIITDEIYADLSFDPFFSIARIKKCRDNLIYLNGFSKAHSMTGWRIGYVAAPEYVIEMINKIHQYSALCAPTLSQFAAVEACKNSFDEVNAMKNSYMTRARYFTDHMNQMGLKTIMPAGGLYCFSSIQSMGMTSLSFAQKLLEAANVAVVPGSVFGDCGEGYIRSCIATDFDLLKTAVNNIRGFVSGHD